MVSLLIDYRSIFVRFGYRYRMESLPARGPLVNIGLVVVHYTALVRAKVPHAVVSAGPDSNGVVEVVHHAQVVAHLVRHDLKSVSSSEQVSVQGRHRRSNIF